MIKSDRDSTITFINEEDYKKAFEKDYEAYGDVLKYLCLKTNVLPPKLGENILSTGIFFQDLLDSAESLASEYVHHVMAKAGFFDLDHALSYYDLDNQVNEAYKEKWNEDGDGFEHSRNGTLIIKDYDKYMDETIKVIRKQFHNRTSKEIANEIRDTIGDEESHPSGYYINIDTREGVYLKMLFRWPSIRDFASYFEPDPIHYIDGEPSAPSSIFEELGSVGFQLHLLFRVCAYGEPGRIYEPEETSTTTSETLGEAQKEPLIRTRVSS